MTSSTNRNIKPSKELRPFNCSRDDKGNAVVYQYKPEDGVGVTLSQAHERNRGNPNDLRRSTNRYLKRILYGNVTTALDNGQRPRFLDDIAIFDLKWMFETVFDYGEHDHSAPKPDDLGPWVFRADPFSTYRSGFEVRTTRLCQWVLMFHHFAEKASVGADCLVRPTDFVYSHEQGPGNARGAVFSFLYKAVQTGHQRKDGGYLKRSLPPVEFEYSQPIVQDSLEMVDAANLETLAIDVDGSASQCNDLHGEGAPGFLTEQVGTWLYELNISPVSEPLVDFILLECVLSKSNIALASAAPAHGTEHTNYLSPRFNQSNNVPINYNWRINNGNYKRFTYI